MKGFCDVPRPGYTLPVNGFTDIGRGTLGSESGAGKEANPLAPWLLADS